LYIDAEGSAHSSLHANVLPLLFGLTPEKAKPRVLAFIQQKGMNCGVYFANFVLKALFRSGETEAGFALLNSDGLHSWGNMLKKGATTTLEAWDPDLKANTSFCHPWACCPITIIAEEIMGISPLKPGWDEIEIAPRIPGGLSAASLALVTWRGNIAVAFAQDAHALTLDLDVPGGALARLRLPSAGKARALTINGSRVEYEIHENWLSPKRILAPGKYRVELLHAAP